MPLAIPTPVKVSDLPAATAQREAVQIKEIQRAMLVLFGPDQIVELRALNATQSNRRGMPATYRGYYDSDHIGQLAKDALSITASGVYVTIQEINQDLHARAFNRAVFCGKSDPSTSDGDVVRFRWLFVDLDPKRPAGISSSDAELLAAHEHALHVREALMAEGWPAPVWATSGNGSHLLWRIDLPKNDDRFTDAGIVEKCLKALDARFSIPQIKIDTTNFNPSRISKLYGTLARKGDDMPSRPHRLSHIIHVPDDIQIVSREQLEALAATAPAAVAKGKAAASPRAPAQSQPAAAPNAPKKASSQALASLDVEAWAATIPDLALGEQQDWRDGKKWKVEPCPCDRGCPDGAAIIQDGTGRLSFKCHHDNCPINHDARESETTQWATFRTLAELRLPADQRKQRRGQGQQPPPAADPIKINDDGVVIDDAVIAGADLDDGTDEGADDGEDWTPDSRVGEVAAARELDRDEQQDIRDAVLGPPDGTPPPAKKTKAKPKQQPKQQQNPPSTTAPANQAEGSAEGRPERDPAIKDQIDVDHSLDYVTDALASAPVSVWAVIPAEFGITRKGQIIKAEEIDGDIKTSTISARPILITARLTDSEHTEHVRLSWPRDAGWVHRIVPRSVSADRSKLIALADFGAPVTTGNAAALVDWLQAYESENINVLPRSKVSKQQGWQPDGGFLMGDQYVAPDGEISNSVDDDPMTWNENRWTYAPDDDGARQDATAFRDKLGTFEGWKEALMIAKKYPRVLLSFYVAITSPLLKLMGHRSLIVDYSGKAGSGKTSIFHFAASIWGYPSELDGRVIRSWDGKLAGIEGIATARGHMPVFFDDSKSGDPLVLQQIIYKLVAGMSKLRGAPLGGSQSQSSWRTVFLSTGESRLIDFAAASDGGARQRVISLHGQHWGAGRTPDVNKVRDIVAKNYGHVGQQWISWVVKNHKARLGEWRQKYAEYREKFQQMAGSDTSAERLGYDLSMFRLAADLVHEALDLPFEYDNTIESMMDLVKETTSESQAAAVALRRVWEWCVRFQDRFEGRRDKESGAPIQGWAGKWDDKKSWDHIILNKDVVREILYSASFQYDSVVREWSEDGWIKKGEGKHLLPKVCIDGERDRGVVIWRKAIEDICIGADDPQPPTKAPSAPATPSTPPPPPAEASAPTNAPQTEAPTQPQVAQPTFAAPPDPPPLDWDEVPVARPINTTPPTPTRAVDDDDEAQPEPQQLQLRTFNPPQEDFEDEDDDEGNDPFHGIKPSRYKPPKAVE